MSAKIQDKEFLYGLNKYLSENEFTNKIHEKRGYVLLENSQNRMCRTN